MKCKTRIEMSDSLQSTMFKMSDGNPGALSVCMDIMEHGGRIDPDNALGAIGTILSLDTVNVYGPRIWMLYKDVCGENLSKMIGLIRANQLLIVDRSTLDHAIDNRGDGIDVDDLGRQVKRRLSGFVIDEDGA